MRKEIKEVEVKLGAKIEDARKELLNAFLVQHGKNSNDGGQKMVGDDNEAAWSEETKGGETTLGEIAAELSAARQELDKTTLKTTNMLQARRSSCAAQTEPGGGRACALSRTCKQFNQCIQHGRSFHPGP